MWGSKHCWGDGVVHLCEWPAKFQPHNSFTLWQYHAQHPTTSVSGINAQALAVNTAAEMLGLSAGRLTQWLTEELDQGSLSCFGNENEKIKRLEDKTDAAGWWAWCCQTVNESCDISLATRVGAHHHFHSSISRLTTRNTSYANFIVVLLLQVPYLSTFC